MKIASLKSFSLLGVVLVAASAVTAAVVPSASSKEEKAALALARDGQYFIDADGFSTCSNIGVDCHVTVDDTTGTGNNTGTTAGDES